MAKQTIALGTPPSGVGGDTPRSASVKTNANFDELYYTQSILGTSAFKNVGGEVGQVVGVGTYGIGIKDTPMATSMNEWRSGFYAIQDGNTQYIGTTGISSGNMVAMGFPFGTWGGQLYMGQGTTGSIIGFRAGSYTDAPFLKIYHTGNTTRAADGTLKAI